MGDLKFLYVFIVSVIWNIFPNVLIHNSMYLLNLKLDIL